MSLRPATGPPASSPGPPPTTAAGDARLKAVLQLGVMATGPKAERSRGGKASRPDPLARPPRPIVRLFYLRPKTTAEKVLEQLYFMQQKDGDKLREAWKTDGHLRPKHLAYVSRNLDDYGPPPRTQTYLALDTHFFHNANVDTGEGTLSMEFKLVLKLRNDIIYEMTWVVSNVDEIDFTAKPTADAYTPPATVFDPVQRKIVAFDEELFLTKVTDMASAGPLYKVLLVDEPMGEPQPAGEV